MTDRSFVSRINQLDAIQLDNEIYKVLRDQISEVSKYFDPGKIIRWEPELDVFIKYFIWRYSLKNDCSTFGQNLLNLSYKNLNKRKSILLFLLLTVPNYLQKRLINENFVFSRLSTNDEKYKYKHYIEQLDNILHLINFIWSLVFLHMGNQPHWIEKILGIYCQSLNMNKPRPIGYSYMTRELLWHGLIELFTVGIPMIDIRLIQNLWNNLWSTKKVKYFKSDCKLTATTLCSYCKKPPILPHWAGCHIFCYYCLKANFMVTDPYQCPICNNELCSSNMKCT